MEPRTPPPLQSSPPPAKTSKWPTTIGIIALVFGILGLLGSLVGIANPFLISIQMDNAVQQGIADREVVDAYVAEFSRFQWIAVPIGFVLGAILTIGGILLLKRKPAGSLALRAWSVLKILGGGFLLYKGAVLSGKQFGLLVGGNAAGTSQAEMIGDISSIFTKVVVLFQGLWLIALPLFLLIWFGRSKIREEISGW